MNDPIKKIIKWTQEQNGSQIEEYAARAAGDSEIEKVFLTALFAAHKYDYRGIFHDGLAMAGNGCRLTEANIWQLTIKPQAQIGPYRVDYLIVSYDFGKSKWNDAFTRPIFDDELWRRLVIECDGHDFHERTKEQAARDRSRDRKLTLSGYTVLRFTGSELWRNPIGCAQQVLDWSADV